jgi:hypothetical protein
MIKENPIYNLHTKKKQHIRKEIIISNKGIYIIGII